MAESFLEEQLKRIREMTEQMSRVRNRAAELEAELARDRELRHEPSPKRSSAVGHGRSHRSAVSASRRRR